MRFIHRSWMKSQGLPDDVFDGRPVIGICNTWSELTPCNAGLRDVAEHVKRGVWEAGGLPLEFPAMSLGETQMRPTAMLFRNLLAMEVEESIRGNPIDAVVLLGGCDKTTPGQLMGAASVDLPTLVVSSGPMLNGKFRGRDIGSGTDVWKFSEAVRAGEMSLSDFMAAEARHVAHARHLHDDGQRLDDGEPRGSDGHRPPLQRHRPRGRCASPRDRARKRPPDRAHGARRRAPVEDPRRAPAFENAIRVLAAIGGSTNAVLHLLAHRRAVSACRSSSPTSIGSPRDVPLLVDLQPSGRFLMEDLHYAGGLPAVMKELGVAPADADALTVSGADARRNYRCRRVLQPRSHPHARRAGQAGLRHLGAEGQPVSRRRRDEAERRQPDSAAGIADARWSSNPSKTCARASMTRRSTSTRRRSWC